MYKVNREEEGGAIYPSLILQIHYLVKSSTHPFMCYYLFIFWKLFFIFYVDWPRVADSRVILVCTVLVATTYRVKNNRIAGYSLTVPPGTADTTVRTNGRVYVKYNDFEFYPLYLVYYRRKPEDRYLSKYYTTNSSSRII